MFLIAERSAAYTGAGRAAVTAAEQVCKKSSASELLNHAAAVAV